MSGGESAPLVIIGFYSGDCGVTLCCASSTTAIKKVGTLLAQDEDGLALLLSGGTFLYTVAIHVIPELARDEPSSGGSGSSGSSSASKMPEWMSLVAIAAGTLIPWVVTPQHSH